MVGRLRHLAAVVLGPVVVLVAPSVILGGSGCAPSIMSQPRVGVTESPPRNASNGGAVRVIVQIRLATRPEGELGSADAVASQRQAIAVAQSAILAELAGTSYRVLRAYEMIPFLALEVLPDALKALERSGLVVSVEEDRLESPQAVPNCPMRD